METFLKHVTRAVVVLFVMLCVLTALFTFAPHSRMARVLAQASGYHFTANGYVGSGQTPSILFEPYYNAGVDSGIMRLGNPGQIGYTSTGGQSGGFGQIIAPGTASVSGTSTGGAIGAGTYYCSYTFVTALGGETIQATDASTGALTGTTNEITITAPTATAGAIGWVPYCTAAGATGTTGTEISQPLMSATNVSYCGTLIQIFPTVSSGYQAGQSDRPARFLCPFGTNWVGLALVASPTVVYSTTAQVGNQPGSTATINYSYGYATPVQNSASYPEALPTLACNWGTQAAIATVTTAQTMASCTLAPGVQNIPGKVMRITAHGLTTLTGTPTLTFAVTEGGITPITVTTTAETTGGITAGQWGIDFYLTTSATGASGTLEPHGTVYAQQATAANSTAVALFADQKTAVSAAINLIQSNTLAITGASSATVTSITLRDAQVWILN